jgi:hypothetical protein
VEASVQVAPALASQMRHPLRTQPERPPILSPRRDLQGKGSAIGGRNVRLAAKEERFEGRLHLDIQVVAASVEARIGTDGDPEEEIARGSSATARTALPADPDPRAGPDARRDLDLEAPGLAVLRSDLELERRPAILKASWVQPLALPATVFMFGSVLRAFN